MKSKFPPVQLQVPLHTWRPALSVQPLPGTLLLQGIKLEGLVVPQQKKSCYSLHNRQTSYAGFYPRDILYAGCVLNGSHMCTHKHKGTNARMYI